MQAVSGGRDQPPHVCQIAGRAGRVESVGGGEDYGFHGEMAHFVDCVLRDGKPLVTGEDGRAVLEVVFAAYESARTGGKVALPFESAARKPIDLWWAPGR